MVHQYCLYYKNGKLQFGWIQELKKNKLLIIPEKGKEFTCSLKQTELVWKGKEYQTAATAITYLSQKVLWVQQRKDDFEIETIHELCEPAHPYTLQELGEDFLNDPTDGWELVALLFALKENRRIFQQKKECFLARSQEEIEKIDLEKKRQELLAEKLEKERSWADLLQEGKIPHLKTTEQKNWEKFIQRLKLFLIHLNESAEKDYFCQLFGLKLQTPLIVEDRVLSYLRVAEAPLSWGRLQLERGAVKGKFEQQELEAVTAFRGLALWENPYQLETLDQRELKPVTIDATSTKDYDDALSWQITDSGFLLRVHIADVASFITLGNPLFTGASKRVSSLYTLKKTYHMLPPELAENIFSLRAGAERAVMTLEIEINQDCEYTTPKLYRSVIKVHKNLSYEKADRLIEREDEAWLTLSNFCQKLKQNRLENGALDLERQEIRLNISNPNQIVLLDARQNTAANQVVEELAIFTNSIIAKTCHENGICSLFRNQPPYKILTELGEDEKPQLQDLQIKPATISLTPTGHSALGLECYLQSTSPIRRFSDLICQGILFSSLAETEPPYPEENLQLWAKQCELTQKLYNKIERELLDYWKYKYLLQNLGTEYKCHVIRCLRNGNFQLLLSTLQLQIETSHPGLEVNSTLKIITEKVNPVTKTVKFKVVADHVVKDDGN